MIVASIETTPLQYSKQPHRRSRWLKELGELLAFPTVSAQPRHRHDIEAAARWLTRHLSGLGLDDVQTLPGPSTGPPSVYAEWLRESGKPTLLLYGHFDVQPADPGAEWRTSPFHATTIGQNMFARGASDDKGQLFIHLKAIESYLRTSGRLPVNIKIWLEGEEENNSPNLGAFLDREAGRLRADAVLVSDTEMAGPGKPSIIYGLRGALAAEVQVAGPAQDLHSGRYGGAVHNPLQALCEIIARLHDQRGRVAIPGFYGHVRPVEEAELQELRRNGTAESVLVSRLGIPASWGEAGCTASERMTVRPSLSVTGITGGYTGPGNRAIIPAGATARLSLRLVPDQEPREIAYLLHRHLATITPHTVRTSLKVTGGSPAVVMSRRHPAMGAAVKAVEQTWGVSPVFARSGGTIPLIAHLYRRLRVPIVLLGFGLADDNIHAPNEKINLPTFFRGVETVIRFLDEYGR